MDVLVAGATGALGRPLVAALVGRGHTVHGLSRTPGNHDALVAAGASPVIADAMDRDALLAATRGLRLDAVVHVLTALKKPPLRYSDLDQTNRLRRQGTANLLDVARATGARRFVVESMHLGYGVGDWGDEVITEETPFAPPGRAAGQERMLAAFRSLEAQVRAATEAGRIEGVSLRFGAFYGRGATEEMVTMLRQRRLPLVAGGTGVMHWIHLPDAAAATVAALEVHSPAPAYNVVDDEPVSWRDFVGMLTQTFDTPKPLSLPRWLVRLAAPNGAAFMTSRMRVSNAKAKRELGWAPGTSTYRDGIAQLAASIAGDGRGVMQPAR